MQLPPLPLSSHAKPVDVFQDAVQLEKELTQVIKGEVRFDRGSRALYATDGSNYRQIPIGLVVPRDDADVIAAVGACREDGAPVLARGAGTSLAGQDRKSTRLNPRPPCISPARSCFQQKTHRAPRRA